jgi:hypothetical protein
MLVLLLRMSLSGFIEHLCNKKALAIAIMPQQQFTQTPHLSST